LQHGSSDLPNRLNSITETIIGCALDVHRSLGPGMLESSYEACLTFELLEKGLAVERQVPMPLIYRNHRMDVGYRLDLLVEKAVVVEVKAIERLQPVHSAQLLAYLRSSGCKVGLLFNFNVHQLIRGGLKRVVNGFPE
jgi:GxxExxY protein